MSDARLIAAWPQDVAAVANKLSGIGGEAGYHRFTHWTVLGGVTVEATVSDSWEVDVCRRGVIRHGMRGR